MNILMIHPHDIYSNLEPWTCRITNLAEQFTRRGHKVKLLYHLLDTDLPLEEAGKRQEFEFETIPLIRFQRTLFRKLGIISSLAEWADVIHFQKCFAHAALPAIWGAYRHGKPVHYDWDDWEYEIYNYFPPDRLIGRSLNTFETMLPKLVDTVSVASESLRRLCIERGVREDRIFEAHVGADLEMFRPDIDDGTEMRQIHDIDGQIVLYVGQLHGAQYCEMFLHAASRILPRRDNVYFMVVGGGDRFGELHYLAEQLGIAHRTVFTDAVKQEMVPRYMASADVAVACFEDNKQQRSKSPLKIVEYMACGKAIVASEVGEVPKMLDGCGILAAPGDVGSLVYGIEKLLDDEGLRRELGQKARKRAEDKYNWDTTASNILQAYHVAIEMTSPRGRRKKKDLLKWIPVFDGSKEPRGSIERLVDKNRCVMGAMDGQKVYAGPHLVQLDVTYRCNNNCIACWCKSPLLGERSKEIEHHEQELTFDRISRLIDELHGMGTKEIYMAGGGEPTMHPRFMDILHDLKRRRMVVYINTNFTLIDRRKAEQLVDLGVDHLTVSLWAGTAETYSRCHPNKTDETFHQMVNVLKYLCRIKQEKPVVKIYNVISNLNYHEIEAMVDVAFDVGADLIEFTMVDTIPGHTDVLLLSQDQLRELQNLCKLAQEKLDRMNTERERKTHLFRFDEFVRRISTTDTLEGNYDKNIVDSIPCYAGWYFARILPDGYVNSCLKSHRIPVGNIHQQSFEEIWTSPGQTEFRLKTRVYKKDDPFFSMIGNDPSVKIGCYKSCDNLGHNQTVQKAINELNLRERLLLSACRHFVKAYN